MLWLVPRILKVKIFYPTKRCLTQHVVIYSVALLSMPRLLVTFSTCQSNETGPSRVSISQNPLQQMDRLYTLTSQFMKQRERIPEVSNTGLLLAWMKFHVQRTARAISEIRAKTLELDESFDNDHDRFDFDEMIQVKNLNLRVLAVAEEQHTTVEALIGAEDITEGLDFSDCKGSLSILCSMASSNERLGERYVFPLLY